VKSQPKQRRGRLEPGTGLLALSLGFAIVAYRELLAFDPARSLSYEVESFFFRPSHSSPIVILALSLWLVFRRRERLRSLPGPGGPAWLTGSLWLAGGLILAWSTYTGAPDLLVLSLVGGGLGAGVLYHGRRALRVLALPAAFLLLAIPVPAPLLNRIVFSLQLATAELTGRLLHGIGVPAFISGDQIVGSSQLFAVIESCSGLRSMETLTIIAVLLIDLFRRSGWHAWIVLLAAPPLGFALNGLRAVTLVLNPHSEIVAIHNLQGIAILLAGLMLLYALDGVLARVFRAGASRPPARPGHPPPAPEQRPASTARALALFGASALAAAISLWLPAWQPLATLPLRLHDRIGEEIGGWRSRPLPVDYQFLGGVRFGELLTRRYRDGRDSVDVFIGVGERDQRLRSSVSPKTALPGSGWSVEQTRVVALEPSGLEVESRVVRSRSSRRLVYHWQVGTESLGSEALRSLLALDASRWRRPGEVLVVRISTAMEGPDAAARHEAAERLLRFYHPLSEDLASLQGWLARKRFS
jgi:EpsI family protein